ncbi:hypothetical protein Fmac_028572 [Flemingia macrophylla]|uniref:Uncharacterized protein n=1 Tax=Flemingia macrophylla TaxID=520843 RepID=A0ABD1L7W2_9FABA
MSLEELMMWLQIHLETRKLGKQARCSCELGDLASCESKPASVARVYGIRSSNDHHTSPASVARVCGIHSSNDHHGVCPSSQPSGVDENREIMLQTPIVDHHKKRDKALDREDGSQLLAVKVHEMMPLSLEEFMMWLQDTSAETRKVEGKLDALVNLVTQLATNQKLPALVARVCDIRSFNDHHTSICPSSQQSGVDEHPEAYAANTYSRPPKAARDKALDREDGSQLLEVRCKK